MWDPNTMGLSAASVPARVPTRLPATSMLTSSPASRINLKTYSRPALSAAVYATRLTPPWGFLPNSDRALRCSIILGPLTLRGAAAEVAAEQVKVRIIAPKVDTFIEIPRSIAGGAAPAFVLLVFRQFRSRIADSPNKFLFAEVSSRFAQRS